MSIIHHNPFRTLGLMANATERELQKQISHIKRHAEIKKTATFDTDYEFLETITRTLEDVQVATGKIEQGHQKRHYALFWMVKSTQFDEIAFNNLKENNTDKAIDIWEKTLKSAVTDKNFSSYLNLSTLYAALSVKTTVIDLPMLQKSFEIKSQVLNSASLKLLSELISTNSKSVDATEISKRFVDEAYKWLKPYIDKPLIVIRNNDPVSIFEEEMEGKGITVQDLINLLRSYPENIRTYFSDKFTGIPISNIETNIDKTEMLRKEDPRDAEEFAQELYDKTIDDLKQIEKILGAANIQYQMLASKLAGEILQCAIEFYNEFIDDDEFDPGDEALRLCLLVKSIGTTGQIVERIEDTTKTIQEWVDGKSEREAYKKIAHECDYIKNELLRCKDSGPSIQNARLLIEKCEQKLLQLKTKDGGKPYMDISNLVVNNALGMIINEVNEAQAMLSIVADNELLASTVLNNLSALLPKAETLLHTMKSMDMSSATRTRLNTNTITIVNINNQIKAAEEKRSSGCYIATMAYGSYEHPQVLILREYRDHKLSRSTLGRAFIKSYYAASPYFVVALKNHHQINKLIRSALNIFIRSLKNE
jgi:hypothetical protein